MTSDCCFERKDSLLVGSDDILVLFIWNMIVIVLMSSIVYDSCRCGYIKSNSLLVINFNHRV